jgi:hypothetical protein
MVTSWMLGKRLQQADEIARRRAEALPKEPRLTQREFNSLSKLNSREGKPHRERGDFELGHFRRGKGSCDCEMCRAAKAKRSKGERKAAWRRERGLE